jgi:hypothetical protein
LITALAARTEEIRRFHAAPWPFQRTFLTPHKDLSRFVSVLLAQFPLESGALSTDEVVFEPECLLELMATHSIHVANYWHMNLSVEGQKPIAEFLEAALGDPVDFVFLPYLNSSRSMPITTDTRLSTARTNRFSQIWYRSWCRQGLSQSEITFEVALEISCDKSISTS